MIYIVYICVMYTLCIWSIYFIYFIYVLYIYVIYICCIFSLYIFCMYIYISLIYVDVYICVYTSDLCNCCFLLSCFLDREWKKQRWCTGNAECVVRFPGSSEFDSQALHTTSVVF